MFVLAHVAIFLALIFLVLVFGIYTPEKVAARKPKAGRFGWSFRFMCLSLPVSADLADRCDVEYAGARFWRRSTQRYGRRDGGGDYQHGQRGPRAGRAFGE